jgi:hypothetical protein
MNLQNILHGKGLHTHHKRTAKQTNGAGHEFPPNSVPGSGHIYWGISRTVTGGKNW